MQSCRAGALILMLLGVEAAVAADSLSTGPTGADRPKKIYAHYMGCYPVAAAATAHHRANDAHKIRHDGAGQFDAIGDRWRNWPLVPDGMKLTLQQSADLEIRRALRGGIDGFAIDAWAGGQGAKDVLDALLQVARDKDYPFEITICLFRKDQVVAAGQPVRADAVHRIDPAARAIHFRSGKQRAEITAVFRVVNANLAIEQVAVEQTHARDRERVRRNVTAFGNLGRFERHDDLPPPLRCDAPLVEPGNHRAGGLPVAVQILVLGGETAQVHRVGFGHVDVSRPIDADADRITELQRCQKIRPHTFPPDSPKGRLPDMEAELISYLRRVIPPHPLLKLGPGDDAAVLQWALRSDVVVTVDMLMDGVDFKWGQAEPRQIGHKSLAVNLSDLAAMAARPLAAVVAVALPRAGGMDLAVGLFQGILPLAERYDLAIAGGDTNSWDGPLVISITALGQTTPRGPLCRGGAQPGDAIVVTGRFGGSILGRHLACEPRVREALLLHEHYALHAGIDVSDGLSLDLWHICQESGCGAELDLSAVPMSDDARRLADQRGDGSTPLDHALSDGEDFELVFAVPPADAAAMTAQQPLDVPLTVIGRFVPERGLWQVDAAGRRTPLVPQGYQHELR